jgi:hypothetical protein
MDVIGVLSHIEGVVASTPEPDADALRSIRTILDDPSFLWEMKEHIHSLNDPDTIADILTRLTRLMREFGDLSDKRKVASELGFRVGLTTGVGMVAGAIVAAVTATVPWVVLIPIFGGGWMSWTGYHYGTKLSEEAQIYKNLSERMTKIVDSVESGNVP